MITWCVYLQCEQARGGRILLERTSVCASITIQFYAQGRPFEQYRTLSMVNLHPDLLALDNLYRMRIIVLDANDNRPTTRGIHRSKARTRVFQVNLCLFPTTTHLVSFSVLIGWVSMINGEKKIEHTQRKAQQRLVDLSPQASRACGWLSLDPQLWKSARRIGVAAGIFDLFCWRRSWL